MKTVLSISKHIKAPIKELYKIVADYNHGHQLILPKPPFTSLKVLKGGIGQGTEIQCDIKLLGKTQTFIATVSEVEPGKVLRETIDDGTITTYFFEPHTNGGTVVTIKTEGKQNFLMAKVMKKLLAPAYELELTNLENFYFASHS